MNDENRIMKETVKPTNWRIAAFWLAAAAVVAVDQASKLWVRLTLPVGASVDVLPPLLYFTHIGNPGAAFGFLARQTSVFILVGLAILLLAIVFSRRIVSLGRLLRLALALEVGGAVGNLIDRVRFSYVVDFIDVRFWPVFNLADTAVVIGACLLAAVILTEDYADGNRG